MTTDLILKPYDLAGQSIEIPFTTTAFFNATVAAKPFGKEPHAWLRSKEAQDYLEAFRKIHGTERKQVVIAKRGGEPGEQGTWLHPKLGIPFARWLNPEFAVWADMQIEGILHHPNDNADANPHFRPEKTRKALPGGLTVEQQDAVKALVKSRVEALAHHRQAKAAIACWSAIKSKFGVSYKEVPAERFGEVLSLVARLPLEGEVLEAGRGPYAFPASFWQADPRERIGFLTWQDLVNAESRPLPALLNRLTEDGNDVEGARVEYLAMRHILELQHLILSNVARDVLSYPKRGLTFALR